MLALRSNRQIARFESTLATITVSPVFRRNVRRPTPHPVPTNIRDVNRPGSILRNTTALAGRQSDLLFPRGNRATRAAARTITRRTLRLLPAPQTSRPAQAIPQLR